MNYQDTLSNFENNDHIYEPETRAEEISQDINAVLNDGSVFSQLIANSVGEALARAIDKSGLDAFVNGTIENLKSVSAEAVYDAMNSEQFTHEFAQSLSMSLAQKEVDREIQNLPEQAPEDKEMPNDKEMDV